MSKNPGMTVPIKKRINTELFIHGRAELYLPKWGTNFLANLMRVKVGDKTNNGWE